MITTSSIVRKHVTFRQQSKQQIYFCSRHDILNTSQKLFQRSQSEEGVSVINLSVVSQRPSSSNKRESNPWSTLIPYSLCLTGARRDKTFEFDKVIKCMCIHAVIVNILFSLCKLIAHIIKIIQVLPHLFLPSITEDILLLLLAGSKLCWFDFAD